MENKISNKRKNLCEKIVERLAFGAFLGIIGFGMYNGIGKFQEDCFQQMRESRKVQLMSKGYTLAESNLIVNGNRYYIPFHHKNAEELSKIKGENITKEEYEQFKKSRLRAYQRTTPQKLKKDRLGNYYFDQYP